MKVSKIGKLNLYGTAKITMHTTTIHNFLVQFNRFYHIPYPKLQKQF